MSTILVTGASGFLGRQCLPALLQRDFEIHAVCFHSAPFDDERFRWHRVDLLNEHQTKGLIRKVQPTHLLHLAWTTQPASFWTSEDNTRWVSASIQLLRHFHHCGGRRVVMGGTCAEYDWDYGYCREAVTPLAPSTLYGACKRAVHLVLDRYSYQEGLSAAWARLFLCTAPMDIQPRCRLLLSDRS